MKNKTATLSREFERENRYIVLKRKHLADLPMSLQIRLKPALAEAANYMPKFDCVVVESDWPEYEPVWQMIERRMTGKTNHVGVIVAKTWLDGAPRAATLYGGDSLPGGAFLYLAPQASPDLAAVTLQILKEAKDIPDGLYARAKHLAKPLADPVPPAGGEPEVVAWRSSDAFGAVYAYEPDRPADEYHGLVTLEAHHALSTRLQAEVNAAVMVAEQTTNSLLRVRAELTKARELLIDASAMLVCTPYRNTERFRRIDRFLAHQSAPAAKGLDGPLSELEVLREAVKELEALRDARVDAKLGRGHHVAYAENGVLNWMTGRKFQNCELYTHPAEKPAPVAVAMPERKSKQAIINDTHFCLGWNECLDEVTRLNSIKQ